MSARKHEATFALITEQRLALVDQLSALDASAWETPSLCAGWRVQEVLAHLVTILDLPRRAFLRGTFTMAGFNRRVDTLAKEYGQREPADLLAAYRRLAPEKMAPPVIGPIAPLCDVVVHSLDIEVPLQLPPVHTPDTARSVLDALSAGVPGFTPRRLVRGLRFEATDLEWAAGAGPEVRGTAADLILALAARQGAPERLTGAGASTLAGRLTR